MAVDPLGEVSGDRDAVAVDVLAAPCLNPCLVSGGLRIVLGGKSADPARFADARLGILDADDIAPAPSLI
jgi:hypothetical protein